MKETYIGLMAGTSADGLDAVLVEFAEDNIELRSHLSFPYPATLRRQVLDVAEGQDDRLSTVGALDASLGRFYADGCLALVDAASVDRDEIVAIGSHGQTVRHWPSEPNPFSLQLGDANIIAQLTGITTVTDFRRRDLAAGGQGAPLVPAFHAACLRSTVEDRAILNIGGIANLTILPRDPSVPVTGFDTGPGNVLMDTWISEHRGQVLDDQGAWAASGKPHTNLLNLLLSDDYFEALPPKSTGREHFNLSWLTQRLESLPQRLAAEDVQATLCELTAHSVARAVTQYVPTAGRLLVCGGGICNDHLMQRLRAKLAQIEVQSTAAFGLPPEWVEAMAFAWLARQTLSFRTGNLPAVTGAGETVILGGIYPTKDFRVPGR